MSWEASFRRAPERTRTPNTVNSSRLDNHSKRGGSRAAQRARPDAPLHNPCTFSQQIDRFLSKLHKGIAVVYANWQTSLHAKDVRGCVWLWLIRIAIGQSLIEVQVYLSWVEQQV